MGRRVYVRCRTKLKKMSLSHSTIIIFVDCYHILWGYGVLIAIQHYILNGIEKYLSDRWTCPRCSSTPNRKNSKTENCFDFCVSELSMAVRVLQARCVVVVVVVVHQTQDECKSPLKWLIIILLRYVFSIIRCSLSTWHCPISIVHAAQCTLFAVVVVAADSDVSNPKPIRLTLYSIHDVLLLISWPLISMAAVMRVLLSFPI